MEGWYIYNMVVDGALIRALIRAAERCGGTVSLGRKSGVDPSLISRYITGKVRSVSDGNWKKLQSVLPTVGVGEPGKRTVPVIEWRELQQDPGLLLRNGGVKEVVFRAQGLQMAPQICDRDLIVVHRKENLKAIPENKIVVAACRQVESCSAVCKRLRRINGGCWLFSDEPQGRFFPAESVEIFWVGVVLRKICEL